ncbi:MAG TPA: single-stranded DNA-binding protein [Syntrophales bacterium]|jgi:single-strand DNA-binding protein|nr:single-stranded DNA-binding protein [Syntrophales bacterium]
MNQVIITGNLGDDVKDFFTPDGVAISTFPMAFRSGKDKTSWIRVSCYQKLAELATKCLHKGAKIAVQGMLDQQKWTDTDGNQKSGYRLIAHQIEFIKTDGRGYVKDSEHEGHESENDGDVPF